jgi:hypothetical protein
MPGPGGTAAGEPIAPLRGASLTRCAAATGSSVGE